MSVDYTDEENPFFFLSPDLFIFLNPSLPYKKLLLWKDQGIPWT